MIPHRLHPKLTLHSNTITKARFHAGPSPSLLDRRRLRRAAMEPPTPTPLSRVPVAVARRVLECLDHADLARVAATCREWRLLVAASPGLYARVPATVPLGVLLADSRFSAAVSLSDEHALLNSAEARRRLGGLEELSINHYATAQHVQPDYASLRDLRRLRVLSLQWCRSLRDADLVAALAGMPALVSLRVSACGLLRGTFLRMLPERTPGLLELYLAGLWEVTDIELDEAAGASPLRQLRALTFKDMRQLSLSTVRTFVLRACPKLVMFDAVRQEITTRQRMRGGAPGGFNVLDSDEWTKSGIEQRLRRLSFAFSDPPAASFETLSHRFGGIVDLALDGAKRLRVSHIEQLMCLPNLESLSMVQAMHLDDSARLVAALNRARGLRRLRIGHAPISGLHGLDLPKLWRLVLFDMRQLTDDSEVDTPWYSEMKLPNLRAVVLNRCSGLSSGTVEAVANIWGDQLQEFEMNDVSELSDDAVELIGKAFPALTRLCLSRQHTIVSLAFLAGLTSLRHLNLFDCRSVQMETLPGRDVLPLLTSVVLPPGETLPSLPPTDDGGRAGGVLMRIRSLFRGGA